MSYPQRLYSVRLFLSKQGTFTRIFDVIYEETPDPAFTGTGVSQLMTFFTAPSYIHYSFYHPFYLHQTAAAFDLTSSSSTGRPIGQIS